MAQQTLSAVGWVESVDSRYIYVRTQRQSACGGCQASGGCGTGSLQSLFADSMLIKLPNQGEAKLGDQVELTLDGQRLVHHALAAYGVPLLGFFMGGLLMHGLGYRTDLALALAAFSGMVLAGWMVKRFHRPSQPKIVRVLKQVG